VSEEAKKYGYEELKQRYAAELKLGSVLNVWP
jgi:hypothetical protein